MRRRESDERDAADDGRDDEWRKYMGGRPLVVLLAVLLLLGIAAQLKYLFGRAAVTWRRSVAILGIIAALAGLGVAALAFICWGSALRGDARFDPAQLAFGQRVYAAQCASCHGANLEGQPNWRSRRTDGRLPAPPHDATGHTWHHANSVLFRITKYGPAAIVGEGYASDMPGFESVLSDVEIDAVLTFIRSTWADREREFQERQSRFERGERSSR